MRRNDTIGGAGFLALGVGVGIYALNMNNYAFIGPGLFPFAVGVLISISGLAILIGSFSSQTRPEHAQDVEGQAVETHRITFSNALAIAIVPVAAIVYALFVRTTGSLFMNFLVVALTALVWGQRLLNAVLLGAVTSIGIYLFFRIGLGVPLPNGFLEALIR